MLNIDLLCAFSYFYTDKYCENKTINEICDYLLRNKSYKLKELIYYNRLYNQNTEENKPKIYNPKDELQYPAFVKDNQTNNEKDTISFLKYLKLSEVKDYKLVRIYDDSEIFFDTYDDFANRKTGNKTLTFYSKKDNKYFYIIRGTNGSSQWFDNAKVINKDYSPCETKIYDDFIQMYKTFVIDENIDVTIAGHSKGGLSAFMLGVMLFKGGYKNFEIYTMYAPQPNKNRLYKLLKNDEKEFMETVHTIQIHVADVVGNLFLTENFLEKYNNKICFVGNFDKGINLWKNHEPLNKIVNNGIIVVSKYYNADGTLKISYENQIISKIVIRLSYLFCIEEIEITNPFIVCIMKKTGLIGLNCKKDFYENNAYLLNDFKKNIKTPTLLDDIYFSFDTITNSKKQSFLTYKFFMSLLEDDELQNLTIELFSNKDIMVKMFNSELLYFFVQSFVVKFIKSFNQIEDKINTNIDINRFDKENIATYITKDILKALMHEEFDEFFENKKISNVAKKLRLEFTETRFCFSFYKVILEIFELQSSKSKEIRRNNNDLDINILDKVKGLFVNVD